MSENHLAKFKVDFSTTFRGTIEFEASNADEVEEEFKKGFEMSCYVSGSGAEMKEIELHVTDVEKVKKK